MLTISVKNVDHLHACTLSVSLLIAGRVNSILLQTVPDFNKVLLHLTDTVYTTFIHSLLHNAPDLIIHKIQVWAV